MVVYTFGSIRTFWDITVCIKTWCNVFDPKYVIPPNHILHLLYTKFYCNKTNSTTSRHDPSFFILCFVNYLFLLSVNFINYLYFILNPILLFISLKYIWIARLVNKVLFSLWYTWYNLEYLTWISFSCLCLVNNYLILFA